MYLISQVYVHSLEVIKTTFDAFESRDRWAFMETFNCFSVHRFLGRIQRSPSVAEEKDDVGVSFLTLACDIVLHLGQHRDHWTLTQVRK